MKQEIKNQETRRRKKYSPIKKPVLSASAFLWEAGLDSWLLSS